MKTEDINDKLPFWAREILKLSEQSKADLQPQSETLSNTECVKNDSKAKNE